MELCDHCPLMFHSAKQKKTSQSDAKKTKAQPSPSFGWCFHKQLDSKLPIFIVPKSKPSPSTLPAPKYSVPKVQSGEPGLIFILIFNFVRLTCLTESKSGKRKQVIGDSDSNNSSDDATHEGLKVLKRQTSATSDPAKTPLQIAKTEAAERQKAIEEEERVKKAQVEEEKKARIAAATKAHEKSKIDIDGTSGVFLS